MKKKSLLFGLTAMLMCGNALASANARISISHSNFNPANIKGNTGIKLSKNSLHTRSGDAENLPLTDIIWDAQGERKIYDKEAAGTWLMGDNINLYSDTFPVEAVWGEDNDVYLKNILSAMATDTYIKGTASEGRITVPVNQTVAVFDGLDYEEGVNFGVLKRVIFEENGETFYKYDYDPDFSEITYLIDEEGNLKLDLPGEPFDMEINPIPEYAVGFYYTNDGAWTGYADFFQDFTLRHLELITIPEGVETSPYVFIDSYGLAQIINVAFTEDAIYIQGLSNQLPEAVVKAVIEGDKAYIEQDEYLGIYFDMFFVFTKVLIDNPDYDEEDWESTPLIFAPASEKYALTIEEENKIIRSADPGQYLSFHTDLTDVYMYLSLFNDFEIKYQDSFAGIPQNPKDLEYTTDFVEAQGFNDFMFTLSNASTEGGILDSNGLYYIVYIDGEPLVFEELFTYNILGEETLIYEGVPAQQKFMPYNFSNDIDIMKWSDNIFDVGIYIEGVSTIGVQTMYLYDNETTYSDIVTLDVATGEITTGNPGAGIENLTDSYIISTEYFDLNGRKISKPSDGIFLRKQTLNNGKSIVEKIICR